MSVSRRSLFSIIGAFAASIIGAAPLEAKGRANIVYGQNRIPKRKGEFFGPLDPIRREVYGYVGFRKDGLFSCWREGLDHYSIGSDGSLRAVTYTRNSFADMGYTIVALYSEDEMLDFITTFREHVVSCREHYSSRVEEDMALCAANWMIRAEAAEAKLALSIHTAKHFLGRGV